MSQRTVFITGASRGIGRATALLLDHWGYRVFAGVRQPSDAAALRGQASLRLLPVTLDLLDRTSVQQAFTTVSAELEGKGLGALINNAGLAVPAPVEFVPLDDLRYQFEVNVFGTTAVTQAAIPLLRQARGRIINVSSIVGRISAPLLGAYSASKFALEALTDALRLELKPWGIEVVSIQPGAIATDFGANALRQVEAMLPRMSRDLHHLYGEAVEKERARAQQPGRGIAAERVAAVILRALEARRPRTRYTVGSDARMIAALRSVLPDPVVDRLILALW